MYPDPNVPLLEIPKKSPVIVGIFRGVHPIVYLEMKGLRVIFSKPLPKQEFIDFFSGWVPSIFLTTPLQSQCFVFQNIRKQF